MIPEFQTLESSERQGLAVHRTREPGQQARRLLRVFHGRGIGDPLPRPEGRDPRLPKLLRPPGHEGLPVRRGQHPGVQLPLPRLELRHRRRVGRRALLQGRLPRDPG